MTLAELYASQAPALHRSLTRMLGANDAEDFVGQTFARLAARGDADYEPGIVWSVAQGLVFNEYRDRANRATPVGLSADVKRAQGRFHEQWPGFDTTFDQAVRNLEEEEQAAFILTGLRGLTVREAGALLGVSKDTAHRYAEAAAHSIREELS